MPWLYFIFVSAWIPYIEPRSTKPLAASVDDDAYIVDVEIFAAETGFLEYNNNIRMGRSLKQQKLMTITLDKDPLPGEDPETVDQTFNSNDFMLGNENMLDDSFICQPAFVVDRSKTEPKYIDERFKAVKEYSLAADFALKGGG